MKNTFKKNVIIKVGIGAEKIAEFYAACPSFFRYYEPKIPTCLLKEESHNK